MLTLFIFKNYFFFVLFKKTLFIFISCILFINFYLLVLNYLNESIFIFFIWLVSLLSWRVCLITAVIYLILFFILRIEISHFHCFSLKILTLRKLVEYRFAAVFVWWNNTWCSIFAYRIKLLSEITFQIIKLCHNRINLLSSFSFWCFSTFLFAVRRQPYCFIFSLVFALLHWRVWVLSYYNFISIYIFVSNCSITLNWAFYIVYFYQYLRIKAF